MSSGIVAASCGSLVPAQAQELVPYAADPLPTGPAALGSGGDPLICADGEQRRAAGEGKLVLSHVRKYAKNSQGEGVSTPPPLDKPHPQRPNTRGAAAPLIGSNPPGERNLGASASEYYAQGKATREPCKNPPRRAEGGIRGELVPARKARCRRHGHSAECPRALAPLIGSIPPGERNLGASAPERPLEKMTGHRPDS